MSLYRACKHVTDFNLANLATNISYVALFSKIGSETIWGQWKDSTSIFTLHNFTTNKTCPNIY